MQLWLQLWSKAARSSALVRLALPAACAGKGQRAASYESRLRVCQEAGLFSRVAAAAGGSKQQSTAEACGRTKAEHPPALGLARNDGSLSCQLQGAAITSCIK